MPYIHCISCCCYLSARSSPNPCGSWLACDADTSVCQLHRSDAIAGKPAPTQAFAHSSVHVVNAPLRGVRRHLARTRQPYHRIKGPCTGLNNTKGWERRDVQQTRPDPGI
ncbi:hypothetical protein BFW90_23720 [Pseudomonas fluorescens]|nr:hypothetical protein BFW90_23720 [Pseudomonas fluorescens]